MDTVTREDLQALAAPRDGLAVSLYIPTHRAGADVRENHIRFKNRVQEATQRLEERGLGPREIDALLEPAKALVDDNAFWQQQGDGLAMFLSEGETKQFKVPIEFDALTFVSKRYHLKPLMPLLTGGGRFHVLAASINKVRLFEGTRGVVEALELPEDTPLSLEEATRFDEPTRGQREHGGNAPVRSRDAAAPGTGISHGTGDVERDKKEEIRHWFAWLDNGVRDVIAAGETPLLFAGVDYVFAIYQDANQYPHLLDEHVSGNPDEWNKDEVHEKAWAVLEAHFARSTEAALETYAAVAHEETSSDSLEDIVMNATDARVATLIVAADEERWGRYDVDKREVTLHEEKEAEDDDLLDYAAVQTLLNGGEVHAVPASKVPGDSGVAAVYRY